MSAPALPSEADPEPRTRIFGIRHHGPGSARSLRSALERFRPDVILIEGPADADGLVRYVAAEAMAPPVALLAYRPDEPSTAAFWPYAEFSPEWQALRYGVEHGVRVGFCDLPAANALAAAAEPGDRTDPLSLLAAAGGYDDAERWWDAVIESSSDADIFDAVHEAMAALREAAVPANTTSNNEDAAPPPTADSAAAPMAPADGGEAGEAASADIEVRRRVAAEIVVDAHTLRREAHMRQVMRKALKDGARRLAVVCGAWHAPALSGTLPPAVADARLLKGMPKVKTTLTWVPWTHSRLSSSSGYGAGITSPGWYRHLFAETEQPIARWLTQVAGMLRRHDLPVSSAHIIEAVRLAETLATLRGRPLAGLSEVTEATRSVLCDGDETMLDLVTRELVIGEALGTVPEDTPTVPLEADLRARIRTLRLRQEATERTVELDLRTERDMAKSQLLHRLELLGIDWGRRTRDGVRGTGTFRETWTLQWRPELVMAVVEASRWGTTLATAATARILDRVHAPDTGLPEVAAALDAALLADLGDAVDGLVSRLESVAALDHDITHLLAALPELLRTLRYGDVRGTDTAALARVADGLLVRVCAGLPSAVTGLGADAAAHLRARLDAVHLALATRADDWATNAWLTTLRGLADRDDVHGGLVGRAVRLLRDAEVIDAAESARRFSAALSVGRTATDKAAWIDGFLGGRGLLLVHDRNLLALVDSWLVGLAEPDFVAVLPLLRRTFGDFDSGERRSIAAAIRHGAPVTTAGTAVDFNPARGAIALRAAREILGVGA
ncbi:Uncharacterised protein [Nocardia otitidiscaviarum]|uniref:Uncharacterized protein n=1 Tax=Nocardia otitidiscaviarum TaxID=1823 RepID=A0A378Y7G0_9NOCA|nr:DUF5682 family protein [Nocardia otitidiscaviarum]SUA73024.1 Uncharacterised protein [Nocardia otitidiscaviarum]